MVCVDGWICFVLKMRLWGIFCSFGELLFGEVVDDEEEIVDIMRM